MFTNKYLRKYYLKYIVYFIIGVAALIVVDIAQLEIPKCLGNLTGLLTDQPSDIKSQVLSLVLRTLIVGVIMCVGRLVWRITIFRASSNIEADIRHDMFVKAEKLSIFYYHENSVGTVMAWFTSDLETIEDFLGWGSVMIVDAFFLSVLTLVDMFLLSLPLTLIMLIPVVLIIVWGALVEKFMSIKWTNRQKAFDELYDFSQENFSGIRVIKAFVKENQEIHAFAKVARKNKDVNIDFMKISVLFDVLIEIICSLISIGILGFGAYFVFKGEINVFGIKETLKVDELVTFSGYFESLVWPLIALGQIINMRSRAKASLNRLTNFLNAEEDVKNCDNPVTISECKGKIEFKNYSYQYPDKDKQTLFNINLTINPGEKIGVIGKIGCGKTTLANSLLRIYNAEKDSILIDGQDLMSLDIDSYRKFVGYVPQDNFLFSDTIKGNISFFDKDIDEEKIKDAAKFACIDEDINGFKDGYDTITGERGVTLSGGQKQRLSIARAYIKDPSILIFDDSVSAVDIKTEEAFLKNICELRKDKTTIIVASRVSTVSKMDKIIVLNEGHLEAFDTPEKLLEISPTYKNMFFLQQLEKEVEGGQ